MTPNLLKKISEELAQELAGAQVKKVHQPSPRLLWIKLFRHGKETGLVISARPDAPRMHLSEERFENPPSPPRFAALLRARLTNAVVEAVEQQEGENIVVILFSKRTEEGHEKFRLVTELTGKSSNVILVDDKGTVVDALRHFGEDSVRVVLPGEPFVELKSVGITNPQIDKAPPFTQVEGSWNRGADLYYSALERTRALETLRSELRRTIKKHLTRAERKHKNLMNDKERAEKHLGSEVLAGLLLANFQKIERGMATIEVEDYNVAPPVMVEVKLDPKLAPNENIDRLFKRAKKAKRTLGLLETRLPRMEEEVKYLSGLRFQMEEAKAQEELALIKEELIETGLIKKAVPKKGVKEKRVERAEPVEKTQTKEGFEMLVGKSGQGNDLLVKKYSNPTDLWFHVKGLAGAHVLLKPKGNTPPSDEAILEAAHAAAMGSKARTETKAEVIYTEAKNVKKPKGAKPGMVMVREYKTVVVKVGE